MKLPGCIHETIMAIRCRHCDTILGNYYEHQSAAHVHYRECDTCPPDPDGNSIMLDIGRQIIAGRKTI